MDVVVTPDFKRKAGQHCRPRFSHLSILQNHPFTIASLSRTAQTPDEKPPEDQNLRFYIRTYRGLTKVLAASTEKTDQSFD